MNTQSQESNTPEKAVASDELLSVFPLTTLRDVFNLPTIEQMETCLDELKECMMQARATNDFMVAAVNAKGHNVKKALEWPEVLEWKDDGKGEVGTAYAGPDGKELFSMSIKRNSSDNDERIRADQKS
jgi:hypothetical protein